MTGALSAFFLSNLGRIRDNPDRLYGWLVASTFYQLKIQDFSEAVANLPMALPLGREFLIGKFDTAGFWRDAPPDLQSVARQWFAAKEGGTSGRNTLLGERLGRKMPELGSLADKLFCFEIVRAAGDIDLEHSLGLGFRFFTVVEFESLPWGLAALLYFGCRK